MIVSAEELQKLFEEFLKLYLKMEEAREIAVKELVDKKIEEAMQQHEEDYEHKERMLTAEEIIAEKEAKP